MVKAIVFDAYGTLFDLDTITEACDALYPGKGTDIHRIWRDKQLEYTWLRTLMDRYADFEQVTRDALRYSLEQLGLEHDGGTLEELAGIYLKLRPHPEVEEALYEFAPRKMLILSNGTDRMLHKVLGHSGLSLFFSGILSVDNEQKYKPHPDVYGLPDKHLRLPKEEILFVSCNSWDVAGAKSYGYLTAWVNRTGAALERLDVEPDYTVSTIAELIDLLD